MVSLALLAACEERPSPPGEPVPAAAPQTSVSATLPAEMASAAPAAASAAPAGDAPALQGVWEGSYNAKKGSVVLPPKVKDPARQKDDGKLATGAGTVALTVEPGGELRGTAKGALGAATLVGKVEDDILRASVFPDDPRAPQAMTGILIGKLKEGVIHGEIRVTGPDATVVRESPIELRRK